MDLYISGNNIRNLTERAINLRVIGGRAHIERNGVMTGAVLGSAVDPDAIRIVGPGSYLVAHNTIDCGWADGGATGINVIGQAAPRTAANAVILDNDIRMSAPDGTVFGPNSAGIEVRGYVQELSRPPEQLGHDRSGPAMKIILVFSLFFLAAGAIAFAQAPGHFFETGNMSVVRAGHTATLLPTGKVLIAGGGGSTLEQYESGAGSSAELYDPHNGIFITTGSMSVPRAGHSATLLPDDRVLIVGGSNEMAVELYDSESGSFSRGASMSVPRFAHTATLLNNGKVLIAGGYTPQPLNVNERHPSVRRGAAEV